MKRSNSFSGHHGFTLIELSIVLVIIGLIVGGVLVGQDLIRVAKDRSIVSQVEKINTAVNTFKVKYNCLPGDCPDATDLFPGVINGNGNGQIGGYGSAPDEDANESYQVWLQLSDAGLIAGTFSGVTGPHGVGRDAEPGLNVPTLQADSTMGVFLGYWPGYGLQPTWYGHVLQIGSPVTPVYTGELSYARLTPVDGFYIDNKIDDGDPVMGAVQDINGGVFWAGCIYYTAGTQNPNAYGLNGYSYSGPSYGPNYGCDLVILSKAF